MHDIGDPQFGDQLLGGPVGFEPGHQLQFHVMAGAESGHRLQQVPDALQWTVGRGDRDDAPRNPRRINRFEQFGVDT